MSVEEYLQAEGLLKPKSTKNNPVPSEVESNNPMLIVQEPINQDELPIVLDNQIKPLDKVKTDTPRKESDQDNINWEGEEEPDEAQVM